MKIIRKLLILLAAVLLLSICVHAAQSSVTVQYSHEGAPLADVAFSLYRVEDACPDAQTAYAAVLEAGREPITTGKTDGEGNLTFSGLADGKYLLVGKTHRVDEKVFEIEKSLLTLPDADGSSNITVQPKYSIRDAVESTTYRVINIWEGDSTPPDSVQVLLYRNGELEETVTLDPSGNWQYDWTEDDPTAEWVVVQQTPDGFTVEYDREGNTFIIINSPSNPATPDGSEPADPDKPNLPQTGQLWWPVPVLAIAGILLILLGWVRRKEQHNEG